MKNEKFDFSVTYYEARRPRQYYPDFVVVTGQGDDEAWWVVETKGEIWPNTDLKRQAAEKWCRMMTSAGEGPWEYVFVHQPAFEREKLGVEKFGDLLGELGNHEPERPSFRLIGDDDAPKEERLSPSCLFTRLKPRRRTSVRARRSTARAGSRLALL